MQITARWRFVDEPRIHVGERGVIIRVGPKWVRFRETATGRTTKVRREIYELTKRSRLVTGQPGQVRETKKGRRHHGCELRKRQCGMAG
jgi:hypothetical protein